MPIIIEARRIKIQNFSSALTIRIGIKPFTHSSCLNSRKKRGGNIKRIPERKKRIQSV
jgi:hypothetical protein